MEQSNRARPMGVELPVGTDVASVRRRIEAMEKLLENSFTIPGVNYRVGLDSIAGLVPVVGDLVTAAVIHRNGHLLIAQRPQDGLLGGLWEFPGGKLEPGEDLPTCLQREIREELDVDIHLTGSLGTYTHAYTHFRVTLHAFSCTLAGDSEPRPVGVAALAWVSPAELTDYPMGKIDRQIAKRILQEFEL